MSIRWQPGETISAGSSYDGSTFRLPPEETAAAAIAAIADELALFDDWTDRISIYHRDGTAIACFSGSLQDDAHRVQAVKARCGLRRSMRTGRSILQVIQMRPL